MSQGKRYIAQLYSYSLQHICIDIVGLIQRYSYSPDQDGQSHDRPHQQIQCNALLPSLESKL